MGIIKSQVESFEENIRGIQKAVKSHTEFTCENLEEFQSRM
jgi:hypothetical protein